MKLRTDIPYVTKDGRLTPAGWQALQGVLDSQDARLAALDAKIAAAAAVANATGGTTIDAEARAQLAGIKGALS